MVDHEGHVKEVVWKVARTAQGDAAVLFPVIEDFLPQDAPQRLLPTAASLTGAAPASVSPLTALEAALLTALLGVLLAWLASLLLLRRRPPATPADCTAAAGSDPAAPLVLADLPRVPHTGPDWPAASNSSSATAVMACLRFAKLPYTTVPGFPDPACPANGHVPFLERVGQRISGSRAILRHLTATGAVPADLALPAAPAYAAAAVAVARMCDSDLATAILHFRWVDDEGWARCRGELMRPLGLWAPARLVVGRMARVAALRRTQEQGFGWLSPAEQLALVREELGALSALLGAERQYLFGDRPHAVDAAAFGVLDQMAAAALNPQLAALVGEHANLVAYRDRIRAAFFGQGQEPAPSAAPASVNKAAAGGSLKKEE